MSDPSAIPEHIRQRNAAGGAISSLSGGLGESLPRISFKGTRFRRIVAGEETVHPEMHLDVIIVAASPGVGRQFYSAAYDPNADEAAMPVCWSENGDAPSLQPNGVPLAGTPIGVDGLAIASCRACPKSESGSGQDGRSKACSYLKNFAVMIPGDATGTVYAVKAGGQSIFAPCAHEGYANLGTYAKLLDSRGVMPHQVITRMTFDPNATTPTVMFGHASYLDPAQIDAMEQIIASKADELGKMTQIAPLNAAATQAAALPPAATAPALAPAEPLAVAAAAPAPVAAAAPVAAVAPAPVAAVAPAPVAAVAPAPVAAVAPAPVAAVAPAPVAAAAVAPAPVAAVAPAPVAAAAPVAAVAPAPVAAAAPAAAVPVANSSAELDALLNTLTPTA